MMGIIGLMVPSQGVFPSQIARGQAELPAPAFVIPRWCRVC
jgi:hypothetical protein